MAMTLIEYNKDVMSITKKGESIYYGDVYHFDKTPNGLANFLRSLDINVVIRENKGLGEIHPDELHEDYE